jgi:hypothetical protein
MYENDYGERGDTWYGVAQICLNGHVISQFAESRPDSSQKFCKECGAKTLTSCPKCNAPVRGYHHVSGVFDLTGLSLPNFCQECGRPYPWTEGRIEAARELAEEVQLADGEKQELKRAIDDLVRNTPRAPAAAERFKRLVGKAGKGVAESFRQILVDVMSEAVKKLIWPQG